MWLSPLTITPQRVRVLRKHSDEAYNVGHAHVHLEKAAGTAQLAYSLAGRLVASKSGWLLLEVPSSLVRGAFDALHEPGAEYPPAFSQYKHYQPHISVMRPEEVKQIGGVDKVTERGHLFKYTLGPIQCVEPAGWSEMSKCWFIKVKSPELEKLRKSYGLSARPKNNEFDFHITVAVRRKKVLNENEVCKAAEDVEWGKEKEDNSYNSLCPVCDSPATRRCRCKIGNMGCKNGHDWHTCPIHKVVNLGTGHGLGGGCACPAEKKASGPRIPLAVLKTAAEIPREREGTLHTGEGHKYRNLKGMLPGVRQEVQKYHQKPHAYKDKTPLLFHLLQNAQGPSTPPWKMSKEDANYQDEPRGAQKCANCRFFYLHKLSGDGICSLVSDTVKPDGWCRLWEGEKAKIKNASECTSDLDKVATDDIKVKAHYIALSPIHGHGTFSAIDCPAGGDLGPALLRREGSGPKQAGVGVNFVRNELGRFINHLDEPNATVCKMGNDYHIQATVPIKKGQEIVCNYTDVDKILRDQEGDYTLEQGYVKDAAWDPAQAAVKMFELPKDPLTSQLVKQTPIDRRTALKVMMMRALGSVQAQRQPKQANAPAGTPGNTANFVSGPSLAPDATPRQPRPYFPETARFPKQEIESPPEIEQTTSSVGRSHFSPSGHDEPVMRKLAVGANVRRIAHAIGQDPQFASLGLREQLGGLPLPQRQKAVQRILAQTQPTGLTPQHQYELQQIGSAIKSKEAPKPFVEPTVSRLRAKEHGWAQQDLLKRIASGSHLQQPLISREQLETSLPRHGQEAVFHGYHGAGSAFQPRGQRPGSALFVSGHPEVSTHYSLPLQSPVQATPMAPYFAVMDPQRLAKAGPAGPWTPRLSIDARRGISKAMAKLMTSVGLGKVLPHIMTDPAPRMTDPHFERVMTMPQSLRPAAQKIFKHVGGGQYRQVFGPQHKTAAELLEGGLGDNKPDSAFKSEELAEGKKHELEHTGNKEMAEEIAKDHLVEHPNYYTQLKKIEKGAAAVALAKRIIIHKKVEPKQTPSIAPPDAPLNTEEQPCAPPVNAQAQIENMQNFKDAASKKDDEQKTKYVAFDLDGTLCEYDGWKGEKHFGKLRPGWLDLVKWVKSKGHKVIIWTCRSNTKAVKEWADKVGINPDYVNENPDNQHKGPKIFAHVYIDDRAIDATLPVATVKKKLMERLGEDG